MRIYEVKEDTSYKNYGINETLKYPYCLKNIGAITDNKLCDVGGGCLSSSGVHCEDQRHDRPSEAHEAGGTRNRRREHGARGTGCGAAWAVQIQHVRNQCWC